MSAPKIDFYEKEVECFGKIWLRQVAKNIADELSVDKTMVKYCSGGAKKPRNIMHFISQVYLWTHFTWRNWKWKSQMMS